MKKGIILWIILAAFLCGCAQPSKGADAVRKEPPTLTISIGDETIKADRGSYSWSYERDDGSGVGLQADGPVPPVMVEDSDAPEVSSSADLDLHFDREPESYELRVWKENGGSDPYEQLESYKGRTIFGVIAEWEQGKAVYAFAVNVKDE
ncbi:hypothetical protein LCM20_15835 [Halobacillus litoralis]|uniref:hypothetical protein n=1 Tax=Halobacillus litoralis TaxID=45668 RepID=UPI001CD7A65A|nr:hypothetical protein [Halobacillus litoralis]MCA0972078.1 hypothetical protein [Halobacillus litoralis]